MGKWEEGRLVSKWFIQLRVERAESRNFMVPVLQGSSPQRSSSPGQERQEAGSLRRKYCPIRDDSGEKPLGKYASEGAQRGALRLELQEA